MPICKGCGGSYDSKFKFCPYCGRAKPESESLRIDINISSQDKWETCKIYKTHLEDGGVFSKYQFWAEAIGITGKYLAGESSQFLYYFKNAAYQKEGYSGATLAHTFLVNQLVSDGWEAIPSGGEWWQTQFRRQVDKNNPKPWTFWEVVCNPSSIIKYRFKLARVKGVKKVQGRDVTDFVHYGESAEFKGGLIKIGRTPEMEKILGAFVRQMTAEGFEPLAQSVNENIKKCYIEDTSYNWYLHAFLKRA
jgi:hypothetical protein